MRQPKCNPTNPTIGAAMAAPSGCPALVKPTARPTSLRGNQLEIDLLVVVPIGPSPIPNMTRTTSKCAKPVTSAVAPQNTDQNAAAKAKTFRGPNLSALHPPIKQNRQ